MESHKEEGVELKRGGLTTEGKSSQLKERSIQ